MTAASFTPSAGGRAGRAALSFGREAAMIAATFVGLLLVTFLIGRVMPLDPVVAVVGPDVSAEVYNRVRTELGLDQPVFVQFLRYVGQIARLDFGVSILTKQPVIADIARVFPATMELATIGIAIGTFLGIPLGILAAFYRGTVIDGAVRVLTLVGYSAPVFWKGLMLLLVFYVWLGWAEGPGRISVAYEGLLEPRTGLILLDAALAGEWELFRNAFAHLVLPAVSLGYGATAYIGRMTRSFVLDQLRQEYVTVARVKGLPEWRIVLSHVLPNCAVQLVTTVALTYGLLLEGAVLTETVFAWPGLGQYMTKALFNADMNAVLGGTFVIGMVFVILNLASDLFYRLMDPRAR